MARGLLRESSVRRSSSFGIVFGVALLSAWLRPASALSIANLWNSPSRLTPADASEVLARRARGEVITAAELLEAEKYLRTDGSVSLAPYVATETFARLLRGRVSGVSGDVRVRALPPLLQWLEPQRTKDDVVRIRGESLQVAVLNRTAAEAVTVLRHETIFQDWTLCGTTPCFSLVPEPLRSRVAYELSVEGGAIPAAARFSDVILASDLTGWLRPSPNDSPRRDSPVTAPCDPEPFAIAASHRSPPILSLRHESAHTAPGDANQVLCAFRSGDRASVARITYLVNGVPASAPAQAARSASRNNPLAFALFEDVNRP